MGMDPQTKALHDCKKILDAIDKDDAESIALILVRRYNTRTGEVAARS